MDIRLVTVSLDPTTGVFPADPLTGIDGEVVRVVEHFFHHDDLPRLLLVVATREPAPPARRGRTDPRAALSDDERLRYDALRTWRRAAAEERGVPPYVLLTNRQLAAVARRRPRSLAALREIDGIGEARAKKVGPAVLEVLTTVASDA